MVQMSPLIHHPSSEPKKAAVIGRFIGRRSGPGLDVLRWCDSRIGWQGCAPCSWLTDQKNNGYKKSIYIYIYIYIHIYIHIYIWRWVKTNYIVSFSGMNSHLPALPAMTWGSRHGTRAVLTFRHVVFFGIAEIPSGKLTVCYWKWPIYSWFTY